MCPWSNPLLLFIYLFVFCAWMCAHVFVYLCACMHMPESRCYGIHVEVRGQLFGVGYLLPLCGSRNPTQAISVFTGAFYWLRTISPAPSPVLCSWTEEPGNMSRCPLNSKPHLKQGWPLFQVGLFKILNSILGMSQIK